MFKSRKIRNLFSFLLIITISLSITGCIFKKEVSEKPPSDENVDLYQNNEKDPTEDENEMIEEESEYMPKEGVFPGDSAPDFSLMDREGNEIKLSDLKGKIVYMNFWATWRGLSTYEMTYIQEAYEKYKDDNVVVLAVNVLAAEQIDIDEVNEYLDEKGYTLPVLYDVDGSVMKQYKISEFPTTFIIDREGVIADFVSGTMEREVIMDKIDKVLE